MEMPQKEKIGSKIRERLGTETSLGNTSKNSLQGLTQVARLPKLLALNRYSYLAFYQEFLNALFCMSGGYYGEDFSGSY